LKGGNCVDGPTVGLTAHLEHPLLVSGKRNVVPDFSNELQRASAEGGRLRIAYADAARVEIHTL
jgi:hypothetical protein